MPIFFCFFVFFAIPFFSFFSFFFCYSNIYTCGKRKTSSNHLDLIQNKRYIYYVSRAQDVCFLGAPAAKSGALLLTSSSSSSVFFLLFLALQIKYISLYLSEDVSFEEFLYPVLITCQMELSQATRVYVAVCLFYV